MKKILIITLFGNRNYGNKFQNYAMQVALEKMNMEAYTLTNFNNYTNKQTLKDIAKKITIKKIIIKLILKLENIFSKKREKIFEKFSNKYIKQYCYNTYEEINKEFKSVCIGSDQIWNPFFLNKFYISFGIFSNNAFSYAASFGIEHIPEDYKEEMKFGLQKLKKISVREEKGADIVEQLIGKRPDVLLDPTLLLAENEWDKILEKPKKMTNKKFILTYFLGKYSKERRKYIENMASNNGMEVVNIGQIRDRKYYSIGPSEFLYFLKNCEMLITDSFHGSVFSIIYKKPFYVMNRDDNNKSMNSRIETLLNKFELTERKVENYSTKLEFNCDFSRVDNILNKEREKAIKFLKQAIDMEENNSENKSN